MLAGDGIAAVAIHHHNQHPAAAPIPAGPPLGCPAVVLPPVPSPAPPVTEAAAKAAVALVKGVPVSAASARAMATSDYLHMWGVAAALDSGTYATVWVVTVRTAGAVFTAVIDAGASRVVGTCEGPACSGVPPGH